MEKAGVLFVAIFKTRAVRPSYNRKYMVEVEKVDFIDYLGISHIERRNHRKSKFL